jgi:hypothetical protein
VLSNREATRTPVKSQKTHHYLSPSARRRPARRGKTVRNITVSAAKIPDRCLHYRKLLLLTVEVITRRRLPPSRFDLTTTPAPR